MISEFCLYLIHTMLMFSYRKEYRRFKKADNMHKIYEAQKKLLKEILQGIAVGVDLHKLVGVFFGGSNGFQLAVLFPCDGFEFAIFTLRQ